MLDKKNRQTPQAHYYMGSNDEIFEQLDHPLRLATSLSVGFALQLLFRALGQFVKSPSFWVLGVRQIPKFYAFFTLKTA